MHGHRADDTRSQVLVNYRNFVLAGDLAIEELPNQELAVPGGDENPVPIRILPATEREGPDGRLETHLREAD